MEKIEHKYVPVGSGRLRLRVAEIGSESSPAVVFLHGFPEIWYSWRHQMVAVASAGFRAIAPDYRGYGLSELPPEPEKASFSDLATDLLELLDALSIPKVFVVGKDVGARVAYLFALSHPEKVAGIITLGVPYLPPSPLRFHELLPEGFYVSRWQVAALPFIVQQDILPCQTLPHPFTSLSWAEADFGRFDAKTVVRNVYILFSREEIPIAKENQETMDMVDSSTPLPISLSEEDLTDYGSLYEKSGFQTALQVPYRSMEEEFEIEKIRVETPALFIMGEKDYFFKFPGMEDYIRSEQAKAFVPKLETVYVPEGSHFVQEQFPGKVNQLLLNFLKAHI